MEQHGLESIQRRLWRLVTEPDGVEAALAAEGDAAGDALAALVKSGRGLAATARLGVYANAYFTRLHDCLRDDFAALARALGPAGFHDLVKTYLMAHPPTRTSLRYAGARLAEHLASEPFASIFAGRCAHAADLARLEWALVEAFDASDAPVLAREALAAVAPDAWPELRFELSPSLQLLACRWPVHELRERFDGEGEDTTWDEPPPLVPEPTQIRVWRLGERVFYRGISPLEADALRTALAGDGFGAICERLAESLSEVEAAPRAATLLSGWIDAGLLVRVR